MYALYLNTHIYEKEVLLAKRLYNKELLTKMYKYIFGWLVIYLQNSTLKLKETD